MNEPALTIGPIETRTDRRACRVSAVLQMGATRHTLYFRTEDSPLTGNPESFIAATLLACMQQGAACRIHEAAVSLRFMTTLETIQDILTSWDARRARIELIGARPEARHRATGDRVGTFFTGGVDSFYTLLKHQEEITDLVFVHGFDIALTNHPLRQKTSRMIRQVARAFGKGVVEIETNLRAFLDPYAVWTMGHGAGLASVGHLLSPAFKRMYIPATHTYADLFPCGSHPLLDPLWSTETLAFVHDGCEATRVAKVACLAGCDLALRTLRVCWKNPDGAYNCGRCEKCLRTMINLHVAGVLDRCTTFEHTLDPKRLATLHAPAGKRAYLLENLHALAQREEDKALYDALRKAMHGPGLIRRLWTKIRKGEAKALLKSLSKPSFLRNTIRGMAPNHRTI